jgi:hypothetical protein
MCRSRRRSTYKKRRKRRQQPSPLWWRRGRKRQRRKRTCRRCRRQGRSMSWGTASPHLERRRSNALRRVRCVTSRWTRVPMPSRCPSSRPSTSSTPSAMHSRCCKQCRRSSVPSCSTSPNGRTRLAVARRRRSCSLRACPRAARTGAISSFARSSSRSSTQR